MSVAFVFPGQGSQSVGMLAQLATAEPLVQETFAEASDVLGYDLWKLCQGGPEEELGKTERTQPAMLAAGVATWRVWRKHGGGLPAAMSGHSLGEYSALVCSGALDFRTAVGLVQFRGQAMQAAVPAGQGAMAAVMGLDRAALQAICERASAPGEPVEPANLNGGGQIVISGHTKAVDRAIPEAKGAGAKIAKKLAVSAPFHCSLMKPAAERLAAALADIAVMTPSVPVVANVTAEPTQDPARIKELLVQQVTAPVRWEESVQTIAKLVNFAILGGVLVYFLKTPISAYLVSRSTQIRQDLVTAAELRSTAAAQLADIDRKLQALPAELEKLRAQGEQDVQAERARIAQAAAAERERLIAQTHREIDARLRMARRQLTEHAAELAIKIAEERIKQTITPDDQLRLVDRYAAQLREAR